MNKPAIFLDLHGCICIHQEKYILDIDGIQFIDKSIKAIEYISKIGYPIIIVSNQSHIGKGLIDVEAWWEIDAYIID